jgi:hypothetical protein
LADENAPAQQLADVRANTELARRSLERLEVTDGLQGVAQRDDKRSLQLAERAPAAASGAFGGRELGGIPAGTAPAARGRGGAAGGAGYGFGRASNSYREADTDKEVSAAGIQVAGNETLYKRGKVWIANSAQKIDPAKDADKIKRVKRFSDEYFTLVRENTADENAVLAAQQEGEELLVVLRGQAYHIE